MSYGWRDSWPLVHLVLMGVDHSGNLRDTPGRNAYPPTVARRVATTHPLPSRLVRSNETDGHTGRVGATIDRRPGRIRKVNVDERPDSGAVRYDNEDRAGVAGGVVVDRGRTGGGACGGGDRDPAQPARTALDDRVRRGTGRDRPRGFPARRGERDTTSTLRQVERGAVVDLRRYRDHRVGGERVGWVRLPGDDKRRERRKGGHATAGSAGRGGRHR